MKDTTKRYLNLHQTLSPILRETGTATTDKAAVSVIQMLTLILI